MDISNDAYLARMAIVDAAMGFTRPSVQFRPNVFIDGDQWCALYGANLMEGVAGFGDTPDAAMWDFDREWRTRRAPATEKGGE